MAIGIAAALSLTLTAASPAATPSTICSAVKFCGIPDITVGDGSEFATAGDIGAQINSAYEVLPPSGGSITILPKTGGGGYSFTTPIIATVVGKYVRYVGTVPAGLDSSDGIILNYTPMSGAAVTWDFAVKDNVTSSNGMENITIINNNCQKTGGCGGTAVGLKIGTANGADTNFTYSRVSIKGFDIAYQNLNEQPVVAGETWYSPTFFANRVVFSIGGAAETVIGGQFSGNCNVYKAPIGKRASELFFTNVIFSANACDPVFDYATPGAAHGRLFIAQSHLENSPGLTCHYFLGNFDLNMIGGSMEDDNVSGACHYFVRGTGDYSYVNILGTNISSPRTIDAIVDAPRFVSGLIQPVITSGAKIIALTSGTFGSYISQLPVRNSFTIMPWIIRPPISFLDVVVMSQGTLAGLTSVHPCKSAAEKGMQAVITDAVAPTFLASITGGGSMITPALCDGMHWIAF